MFSGPSSVMGSTPHGLRFGGRVRPTASSTPLTSVFNTLHIFCLCHRFSSLSQFDQSFQQSRCSATIKSRSEDNDEGSLADITDLEPNVHRHSPVMKSLQNAQHLYTQNYERNTVVWSHQPVSSVSCPLSLIIYLRSSPLILGCAAGSREQPLQKVQDRQRHTDSLQSLPELRDCFTRQRGRPDNAPWASAHSNNISRQKFNTKVFMHPV